MIKYYEKFDNSMYLSYGVFWLQEKNMFSYFTAEGRTLQRKVHFKSLHFCDIQKYSKMYASLHISEQLHVGYPVTINHGYLSPCSYKFAVQRLLDFLLFTYLCFSRLIEKKILHDIEN